MKNIYLNKTNIISIIGHTFLQILLRLISNFMNKLIFEKYSDYYDLIYNDKVIIQKQNI